MLAAGNGHAQVVEKLINVGVDVNAENNDGNTALKVAKNKRNKNREIIKMLRQATDAWWKLF